MKHYVDIISKKKDGVLYIVETNDLIKRIYQHKNKVRPKTFSARYNLDKLVYFEVVNSKERAKIIEKQMKKWNRAWKIELIEKSNSEWMDLYTVLK